MKVEVDNLTEFELVAMLDCTRGVIDIEALDRAFMYYGYTVI